MADIVRLCLDDAAMTGGTDLWAAGMTSMTGMRVMLAVEEELGVEFPEQALSRDTFATIDAITHAVTRIGAGHGIDVGRGTGIGSGPDGAQPR